MGGGDSLALGTECPYTSLGLTVCLVRKIFGVCWLHLWFFSRIRIVFFLYPCWALLPLLVKQHLPATSELLEYYREKVESFEALEEDYLARVEALQSSAQGTQHGPHAEDTYLVIFTNMWLFIFIFDIFYAVLACLLACFPVCWWAGKLTNKDLAMQKGTRLVGNIYEPRQRF